MSYDDDGDLQVNFENLGAMLVDKGYQGVQELLREINPDKKSQGEKLFASEKCFNKKVASNRIIAEN